MKIVRLWGIPIHKIRSDAEFVERSEKALRLSRKLVWIHISVLILLALFMPLLIRTIGLTYEHMPDGAGKWVLMGLIFGLGIGTALLHYIISAIQAVGMALDVFDANRGTRLLIKYHSMLREMGALEEICEQEDEQILRQA